MRLSIVEQCYTSVMTDMENRVQLVRRLSRQLQEFLRGLAPADWSKPSTCDLWEVGDVVAHLVGGADRQAGSMVRGRNGDAGPPAGFVATDVATLSANNARRDVEIRRELGDGLLQAFAEGYDRLCDVLDSFNPDGWDSPCWHARRGTITARDYLDLRIQELVIHDWDLRSSFEPGSGLDPEGVAALAPSIPTWLGMCFRPGPRLSETATFRFQVTGSAPLTLDLTCWGDEFEVPSSLTGVPGVTVTCNADAYLLYGYGRITARDGIASGRLSVQGDASLLDSFEVWFKGL